ncbi:uncharacterized protein K452DRAFT_352497 [Aplosporella prunicola CBS 121167]|uniref:Rhodopsin domain-containing protein n=1 Tax=Aplosporella prunicola CBS 121167 TaxID=1176127 RepID=A0A6A6BBA7_9PEZI|nr:uncharacterized protein K452DRAFT_352497 [Aplosporella prunicola CBS 121167]KAF2139761.1 hypothetical protein K452DRAFT_352497 [Aplosporella prunicola CBS 121167]
MAADLSGEGVMAIEWTLLMVAYTLVIARLCVRLLVQRRSLLLSDYFLVISAIDAMALIVCDTATYKLGAMGADDSLSADDPAKEVALNKISFSSNYFYDSGMYFPKIALLTFYFKLFPQTMPRLRKMLCCVTGFTVCCMICTCFLDTFWCGSDVSINWAEDSTCSSFGSKRVFQIDWVMNITSDILVFCLPFPLIRKLQLRQRQLAGLTVTFALGALTMAASVARFATIQVIHSWNNVYVWSMVEMSIAIMVVSLPSLRGLLTGLRSGSAGYSSRTHQYNRSGSGAVHVGQSAGSHARCHPRDDDDDTGSEVELSRMDRVDVIYKVDQVWIAEWILLVVAWAFVALRVYVRLFKLRERLSWADIILILSAIDGLGLIVCDTLTYEIGAMDGADGSVKLSKISFSSNYFYDFGMGVPKLSMLAFYWDFFPASRPNLRKALYVVAAYVCAAYMTILWLDTFYCGRHVSVQWSQEEGACNVYYADIPFQVNFSLNLSCYIFIYALPLALLGSTLKLGLGVISAFSLGFLAVWVCIIRFIVLNTTSGEPNIVYLLSMLELVVAIMAVSLPGLKPLYERKRSTDRESSIVVSSHEAIEPKKQDA